ncbi:recombinase family protein [Streptosporangium sp. NPDC006930]|uniref:recombinase family protein n=1 Tax=Streptosporangium sp. NPDC006930 TaxID=3154783 RepID=UPI003424E3A9
MLANPLPQRAIILCRISDARDDDTAGVDDQERRGRDLAHRLGWGVLRVVVENDVSAFKRRTIKLPDGTTALRTVRPGFRETVDALVSGEADGLIAYDLDRAVRDPRDLEDLIDAVEAKKPRPPVESVTGSLRLANDADITMARVMVAVANKASRDTARRVAGSRERRALNGEWGGGIRPFGFEADGVTVRPDEAAEIRRATDALLAGVSLMAVVRAANDRGSLTSKGNQWSTTEMRQMLMRARNAGKAIYKGEVIGNASWPAIVSESAWRGVVALLSDPVRRTTPGNQAKWLGSGIYLCGIEGCGKTLICSRSGQQRNPAYRCRPRQGGTRGGERHVVRTAGPLDTFVEEVIIERLSRPDAIDLLKDDQREDVAPLHIEALALRQLLDEQTVLHAQRVIDTRQLAAGSRAIQADLKAIEDRIAAASVGSIFTGVVGVEDPRAAWKGLNDLGRQRGILNALMTVTILPAAHGRGPSGTYFDPSTVQITPKR